MTETHSLSLPDVDLVYDVRGRMWERVTDFGEWPIWLADNRRLLFGDGGRSFWVVDTRTKQTTKIYSGGRDVLGPPRLARNASRLVFSRRVNEADIWVTTLK